MERDTASRSSLWTLAAVLAAVLLLSQAGRVTSPGSEGQTEHRPKVVPSQMQGDQTLEAYIQWDAREMPDCLLDNATISWLIGIQTKQQTVKASESGYRSVGHKRIWSLGQYLYGEDEMPYDGTTYVAVAMTAPCRIERCTIKLDGVEVDKHDKPDFLKSRRYLLGCVYP